MPDNSSKEKNLHAIDFKGNKNMFTQWNAEESYLHLLWVSSSLLSEGQDISAHTKLHSATSRPLRGWASLFWASFNTEILLQTETEPSEDILLQPCQLRVLKHWGPLKSYVSVGSPNSKDQQIAGHSQYGRKNAFSVYQHCQDWSCHYILCHHQVLGIKVEGKTLQRKEPKCVFADLTMYLIR